MDWEYGIPFVSFLPFIAIILIFYFLIIRPQNKRKKEWEQKRAARAIEIAKLKAMPMADFLSQNELPQYCEMFEQNKIATVGDAADLTDSDLLNIGVSILGDRKKILSLIDENTKEEVLKCPKCGSVDIQAITESQGQTRGFGCCSGGLGAIIFGPLGWLCGLCGMGKGTTRSTTYWLCKNCGNKFT